MNANLGRKRRRTSSKSDDDVTSFRIAPSSSWGLPTTNTALWMMAVLFLSYENIVVPTIAFSGGSVTRENVYRIRNFTRIRRFCAHHSRPRAPFLSLAAAVDGSVVSEEEDEEEEEEEEIEYSKFQSIVSKDHEEEDESTPLPSFFSDRQEDDGGAAAGVMQRRMEEQQRQIDMLMQLVQQQQGTARTADTTASVSSTDVASTSLTVSPLKAMMFIDGTWLYYSIFERQGNRNPISEAYGLGWQRHYRFDWAALPRVICRQLQQQQTTQGWTSGSSTFARPVEIVRASVFTSVKKDTSPSSIRLKMYEEMNNSNYDVHMMETPSGSGEKCVDIQLAVEMLHYATVQNSYDVAILLSGDKDFLPALIRTRQKGRQVCLVSMRTSCNRDLFETPNCIDFEPIWIEDYLDELMIPIEQSERQPSTISVFTLMKVVYDFIDKSPGKPGVSSRDLGRYLKNLKIRERTLLDEVKETYGGLHPFLGVCGCFNMLRERPQDNELAQKFDRLEGKEFLIMLRPGAEQVLLEEAKKTHFNPDEKAFFASYAADPSDYETSYAHTHSRPRERNLELPEELTRDYSALKVSELKDVCRERGLHVSGTRAVLLERIESSVKEEVKKLQKHHNKAPIGMKRPQISSRMSLSSRRTGKYVTENAIHLKKLVREYLKVSGGEASSRDVGRYLAANKGTDRSNEKTALTELKDLYGGLVSFIVQHDDEFEKKDISGQNKEYRIALRNS